MDDDKHYYIGEEEVETAEARRGLAGIASGAKFHRVALFEAAKTPHFRRAGKTGARKRKRKKSAMSKRKIEAEVTPKAAPLHQIHASKPFWES